MKSIKICVSTILALLAALCMSIGLLSVNTAKADEAATEPETPAAVFKVIDGAYARLDNDDNGAYGIRFEATVGDVVEGATYKMAVVPTELIDLYDADTSESKANIIDWLTAYADSKSGSIATAKCEVNNGKISVALTDIYWVNLNRKFSAIAYYEKDDEKVIANLAEDGSRSIADVVTAASEDTTATYTEDEQTAIDTLTKNCTEREKNIVIGSETLTDYIEIRDVVYKVVGEFSHINHQDKGNVWQIRIDSIADSENPHLELFVDKNEDYVNRFKGFETVKFSFYTPRKAGSYNQLTFCERAGWDKTVKNVTLNHADWTDITISVEDFKKSHFWIIPCLQVYDAETNPVYYYITDFKAYTPKEVAQEVIDEINALPSVRELTVFDGATISAVQNAYNELSAAAKTQVTNYSVLQEIVSAYNENYVVLADMSSTSGFSLNTNMGCSGKVTLGTGYDNDYNNYLSINVYSAPDSGDPHLVLTHSISADMLTNCENVVFYVYNGGANNRNLIVKYDGKWNEQFNGLSLKTGEWTKVQVAAEVFKKITDFGIATPSTNGICEYRISMIYGQTASKAVDDVTAMINALPSADALTGIDKVKIDAAKAYYETLSETAKVSVTNYGTLTALETAYNNKYKVVLDMTSTSGFSINTNYTSSGVTLSVGTDETYGSYLCAKASNQVGEHLTMNYPKASDLSTMLEGYDKVCFYVYCDKLTGDSALFSNFGGAGYKFGYNGQTLKAGEWVKFEISKDDFVSGSWFGIGYNPKDASEYKFSMFWAE